MKSESATLENQVKEYEKLRSGKYKVLKGSSFYDLPIELIRARIALGLTQKQLAKRVGLKEQQIQRYEETDYAAASFSRLTEIIKALGLDIEEKIFLPKEEQFHQDRCDAQGVLGFLFSPIFLIVWGQKQIFVADG